MRINHKNTALGLLTNMNEYAFRLVDDGDHTTRQEKTRLGLSLVHEWHKVKDAFAGNVRYMSKPFYEAYEKSLSKLAKVIDAEPMNEAGTLVFAPNSSETNTIFYHLIATGKGEEFHIQGIMMMFTKQVDKDKPALAMLVHRLPNGGVKEYMSKKARDCQVTDMSMLADIYTLLLFIKYCDIETKIIDPKKSRRAVIAGQKYLNETGVKITVLDSTWFTNLVISGKFEVEGHLHWYYYGPGKTQKRLIWVDTYTKEGYTRKAKAIINNETIKQNG